MKWTEGKRIIQEEAMMLYTDKIGELLLQTIEPIGLNFEI
jgi:hypothetical protein